MGRGVKKVKADAGYTSTVQITDEAKNALVDWINRHDGPHQRHIVGKAVMFCIKAPEEIQQFIFHGIPNSLKPAYANAIRILADEIDGHVTSQLDKVPPEIFHELKMLAQNEGIDLAEYLRRHLTGRTTSRVARQAHSGDAARPRTTSRQ